MKHAGGTLPLPIQAIFPGRLESAYRRELQKLIARNALARLWAKDATLWPVEGHDAESLRNNLSWLDLPGQLGPLIDRVVSRASEIEPAGLEDVVFVTLGDANLAAATVLQSPSARLGKRTFLLDNIDPDSVRELESKLRLEKTLFIFASKSGKDIAAHSLLLYFLERLRVLGIPAPPHHFVALAEGDSYLGQLAGEYGFIDRFFDPPGIHGRFSSLIHFNFFLAALSHLDRADLVVRAQSMRQACGPSAMGEANPAFALGAFLAAAEIEGFDRLFFFSANSLQPLAHRMGYLVGASTCKDGRGIIPVFGRTPYPLELIQRDAVVVMLKMAGEEEREPERKREELGRAGIPLITSELDGPEALGAELFKWEIATALASATLGVNPFHDPDIRESRTRTSRLLEQVTGKRELSSSTVRVREAEIELYAEGETRRELSTLSMAEALRSFFELRLPDGYVALLPFMDLSATRSAIFRRISDQLEEQLGIPVLVTPGPRYLHTLGQVYNGGPPNGLYVLVTANPARDLAIPGADYTFGQMQLALAAGDFESLGRRGRHVIRLHLTRGAESGLAQLETILNNPSGKRHAATR